MKKVILAVAMMALGTAAMADVNNASNSTSTSGANNQGVTVNHYAPGTSELDRDIARIQADGAKATADETVTIKNTPSVAGPNLVTSNDTCMGSTSGSVNIAGLGIGGGTSWTDDNCVMLKNAREMWNMGMKAAALSRMCDDEKNAAAFARTGFVCPPEVQPVQQVSVKEEKATVASTDEGRYAYSIGR